MNVLSLFDGISCGQVALSRVGVTIGSYYASEIDPYAMQITQHNFPATVQLGDVQDWRGWSIDWSEIDLVTGGFPCQPWSVVGNQQGDKDDRGKLFWDMLDIIKHILDRNPKAKFLIENVRMKREFDDYITRHTENALGEVYKTLINSALVSAQNRQRIYWTNFEVTQPKEKGLMLKDILETVPGEHDCTPNNKKDHQGLLHIVAQSDAYTGRFRAQSDVLGLSGKCATLRAKKPDTKILAHNGKYRKVTVTECERLQTLDDGYSLVIKDGKQQISDNQRFKAIGNGWTVDVVAHILECANLDVGQKKSLPAHNKLTAAAENIVLPAFSELTGEVARELDGMQDLTLRDYFAGQALAGLAADESCQMDFDEIASWAYGLSDAMIKARGG